MFFEFCLKSAFCYYGESQARLLAHQLKCGSLLAAKIMAKDMVNLLPPRGILVPIPGRTGSATSSLWIAKLLSRSSGLPVRDVIFGCSRESVYALKKRDIAVSTDFFNFSLRSKISGNIILIDGVCSTGITGKAAAALFDTRPTLVVHSCL